MSHLDSQADQASSLWANNPVLVNLLGISPVLALSDRSSSALAIGLCILLVGISSSLSVFGLRGKLDVNLRYPAYALIMAFYTSLLALVVELNFYPLWRELGIYLYLVAANFALLLKMDVYYQAEKTVWVLKDASRLCLGFLVAILLLALIRETLMTGTVFSDWYILLPGSESLDPMLRQQQGELFRFADLPPAVFILLGLLIAALRQAGLLGAPRFESRNKDTVKRERVTGRLKRKS